MAKLKAQPIKARDLGLSEDAIYWRIDDEYSDAGAFVGQDGRRTLQQLKAKIAKGDSSEDKSYYAVEAAAVQLSDALQAELYEGAWRFSTPNAVKKARTAIVKLANKLLEEA
jgi:hypothetical protein